MVKIRVDYNKLYMLKGKDRIQLESATIFHHPSQEKQYEISVFIIKDGHAYHNVFKQKAFETPPNVIFKNMYLTPNEIDNKGMLEYLFASGSKETPTAPNWYINFYKYKE